MVRFNAVIAVAVLLLTSGAHAVARTIVARPEARTTLRVGDVIVFPLYDSRHRVMLYGDALRRIGPQAIARHDLWDDIRLRPPAGWHMSRAADDAASDRGEAFRAVRQGSGSANVLLLLPRMKVQCASCRTVHYFFTVL